MILYVNGDSHTAAAEAVSPAAFAEDDGYPELGRRPHPKNLAVSWGKILADRLKYNFVCDAESAASNYRIMRTTRSWLEQLPPWEEAVVLIQWSTWERQEWKYGSEYLQLGSSGLDWVPEELHTAYKEFVVSVDWTASQQYWHEQIWQLHQDLRSLQIPHVFFNGNNTFDKIKHQRNWQGNYIDPYGNFTFDHVLKSAGFSVVNANSWHFGKDAHCFWADFVLQYAIQNSIISDPCVTS